MYGELYQYLLLNKKLVIPGIGTFQLERKPAESDIANRIIHPPSYTIALHHGQANPPGKLYTWLASALMISERDAVIRFNDFAFDFKQRVLNGDRFEWNGIGAFTKGMAGEIRFESAVKEKKLGEAVPAVKVLREKAEHTVRVGEEEKTSAEMIEFLHATDQKKSTWWLAALILLILSFIFVCYYLSVNGLRPGSIGNRQTIHAETTTQPVSTP